VLKIPSVEEINVATSYDGRDVVIRYEESSYAVVLVNYDGGEEYRRQGIWPGSPAVRFAKSVTRDKLV
jgi:hypothetical protein